MTDYYHYGLGRYVFCEAPYLESITRRGSPTYPERITCPKCRGICDAIVELFPDRFAYGSLGSFMSSGLKPKDAIAVLDARKEI